MGCVAVATYGEVSGRLNEAAGRLRAAHLQGSECSGVRAPDSSQCDGKRWLTVGSQGQRVDK